MGKFFYNIAAKNACFSIKYKILVTPHTCLVPRRLSSDKNVRAKEGGKETTGETCLLRLPSIPFPWSLAVHHQSRARLYDEKNEAPEEEAGPTR